MSSPLFDCFVELRLQDSDPKSIHVLSSIILSNEGHEALSKKIRFLLFALIAAFFLPARPFIEMNPSRFLDLTSILCDLIKSATPVVSVHCCTNVVRTSRFDDRSQTHRCCNLIWTYRHMVTTRLLLNGRLATCKSCQLNHTPDESDNETYSDIIFILFLSSDS